MPVPVCWWAPAWGSLPARVGAYFKGSASTPAPPLAPFGPRFRLWVRPTVTGTLPAAAVSRMQPTGGYVELF